MPIAERAKQFAPFSPLGGLQKALREKEKIREPKRELSEEAEKEVNAALTALRPGELTTVVFYNEEEQTYEQLTGVVTRIDPTARILQLSETEIAIETIYRLIPAEDE